MGYKQNGTDVLHTTGFGSTATLVDAEGIYGNLSPLYFPGITVGGSTGTINFSKALQSISMSVDLNFVESNKATGRGTLIVMNTGSNTPSFSSNILWANGAEPTWSDSSYWRISMLCTDSALVIATAQQYNSP